MALDLASAPLPQIVGYLRDELAAGSAEVAIVVADPDLGNNHWAGEHPVAGDPARHRSFRVWVDLADRLRLRLMTPQPAGTGRILLRFQPLSPQTGWATPDGRDGHDDPREKYGTASGYARIDKREDPGFVLDLADALQRARLPARARVLDLGVNSGNALALVQQLCPTTEFEFVGIDHSASAIAAARERFPHAHFIVADLAALPDLPLDPFDLVLSVGVLQSPGVDDRAVLRHVVQRRLRPHGAVVIGVPNCSYIDGEVVYGAKMKNFSQPDLSLLVKNVAFYRRYLQQHRKRVFVTGKHYVLVTAVAHRKPRL